MGENTTVHVPSYIEQKEALSNIPQSGIELGLKLFNDKNLSSNGEVSCTSCHFRKNAFSDNEALNKNGVSGKEMKRNSPPLFNLAWHDGFFWDGGAPDLESQALGPLFSEDELDADLNKIIAYLTSNEEYKDDFYNTFKQEEITSLQLLTALKWYQISLVSFNSKYDDFYETGDSTILSISEKKGLQIFNTNCNSCHALPLGSTYGYENNQIDTAFNFSFEDVRLGRNRITNKDEDLGKYKIPSVRNLSFTFPYMHDGRFKELKEVIEHYNGKTLNNKNISLTEDEITHLIDFLYTLNDDDFVTE